MKKLLSIVLCFTLSLAAGLLLLTGCSAGKEVGISGVGGKNPSAEATASIPAPEEASAESSAGTLPKAEYRKITPQEAKAMMDAGGVMILDVRTQEEFDGGHIKDAILLPGTEVAQKAETVLPDKNARILVYCRSGRRSGLSAHALVDMGYTGIYDFGGIVDWPYSVVK